MLISIFFVFSLFYVQEIETMTPCCSTTLMIQPYQTQCNSLFEYQCDKMDMNLLPGNYCIGLYKTFVSLSLNFLPQYDCPITFYVSYPNGTGRLDLLTVTSPKSVNLYLPNCNYTYVTTPLQGYLYFDTTQCGSVRFGLGFLSSYLYSSCFY